MVHERGARERRKGPGERKGMLMGEEESQRKCCPGSVLAV